MEEESADRLEGTAALVHELNNHLTAIRLNVELLETKLDDATRVEAGLAQIHRLAEQAARVGDELARLHRPADR